jgi:hypothetical protein
MLAACFKIARGQGKLKLNKVNQTQKTEFQNIPPTIWSKQS